MSFELPPLPYAADALEPHMSANTFSYHHAKHHKAYVDNLNKLIAGTEFEGKSLVEVVKASEGNNQGVFNNAAQVWNHTFFWHSMSPNGGGAPTGKIAEKINADFGSFDAFAEAFKTAGATQFGSGWAWLVLGEDGKLKVVKTANAETPFTKGDKPILTIDVWEHAYYLDYQNLRPKFIETYLNNLVNWEFANNNLDAPLHPGV
ncbi:superoxide dismutase [Asticcacaulis tiandongensis]|uniref:superoxide dismutase n=1 Tax=Asticcacaulis tiandongensis TaxID=2565365 RepID=UPI00112B3598|nr:superoxide dismutase [Asticcacaulis tiandongensis]